MENFMDNIINPSETSKYVKKSFIKKLNESIIMLLEMVTPRDSLTKLLKEYYKKPTTL